MLVESLKFRCQLQCLANFERDKYRETCRTVEERKTKYVCTVEADASMRKRMERSPHKNHEDHVAGRGMHSLSHYNLVHKFIPMPEAIKNTTCKGSSGEIMGKNSKKNLHDS